MNQEKKTTCTSVILKFVEGEVYPLLVQQQHKQAGGGDFLNMGTTYKYIKISSLYTFCISMYLMTGNKSVVDTCY
jgi:hypothetical protein